MSSSRFLGIFRRILALSIMTLCISCSGGGSGGGGNCSDYDDTNFSKVTFPVTVRAQIDGRSQLILSGSLVRWHHHTWEPPGLWDDAEPTYLNEERWCPSWPSGNLTDCNCDSSSLDALATPLSTDEMAISIDVVTGRGGVTVIQQPSQDNNFTAKIEFNDNSIPGAAWYEIIVSYN